MDKEYIVYKIVHIFLNYILIKKTNVLTNVQIIMQFNFNK